MALGEDLVPILPVVGLGGCVVALLDLGVMGEVVELRLLFAVLLVVLVPLFHPLFLLGLLGGDGAIWHI